jgi:hypothetical protein
MTKKEEWKPIKGWEGLYEVSNVGNVKSLERSRIDSLGRKKTIPEKLLSIHFNKKTRYQRVNLSDNGKVVTRDVHRLVAEAFIPNPQNLPFINHKDEDRRNNFVDNLEWCTPAYNTTYNGARQRAEITRLKKFKPKKIIQYDLSGKQIQIFNCGANELARRIGKGVKDCLNGKCKTAYGMVYRYEGQPFCYQEDIPVKHQKWVEKIDENGNIIERYKSISEAGEVNGFNRHAFSKSNAVNGIVTINEMLFRVEQKENEFIPKGKKGPRPDLLGKGAKKVRQYSKEGDFIAEYPSIKDAALAINKPNATSDITNCCKGNLKTASGFIWRYKGRRPPKPFKNDSLRKIEQYGFEGEKVATFNSIKDAIIAIGHGTPTCIGNNLSGRSHSAYGYVWKYAKEDKQ